MNRKLICNVGFVALVLCASLFTERVSLGASVDATIKSMCQAEGLADFVKKNVGNGKVRVDRFAPDTSIFGRGGQIKIFKTVAADVLKENGISLAGEFDRPDWILSGEVKSHRGRDSYEIEVFFRLKQGAKDKEFEKTVAFSEPDVVATILGQNVTRNSDPTRMNDELIDAGMGNGVAVDTAPPVEEIQDDEGDFEISLVSPNGKPIAIDVKNLMVEDEGGEGGMEVVTKYYSCVFQRGESFEIHVKNKRSKTEAPVSVRVIVDGASSFALFESPNNGSKPEFYVLSGETSLEVKGWLLSLEGSGNLARFQAGSFKESVAKSLGIANDPEDAGIITIDINEMKKANEVLGGEDAPGIEKGERITQPTRVVNDYVPTALLQKIHIHYDVE